MGQPRGKSPEELDLMLEQALLAEIVFLHPGHLTAEELVVRMSGGPGSNDRIGVLDTLQALRRSGLLRINGEVVEPTFAALRAAAIFQCP